MTVSRIAMGVVLSALGTLAVIVLGWLVFSSTTGATLITFRTGSMSPTMPTGTLGVTIPISAADVQLGDVITVSRPDELPVTHRVVELTGSSVSREGGEIPAEAREIIMQGDANATPDFLPYVIVEARKVVFWVPGLGSGLMLLQSPPGMTLLIALAGALTIWAFWPKRDEPETGSTADCEASHPGIDAHNEHTQTAQ